jgi:16S rRNA (cytosine1402-N4)-methyltransferase
MLFGEILFHSKKLSINESGYNFLRSGEFELSTLNSKLNDLLAQRAKRFDALTSVLPQFANNPQFYKDGSAISDLRGIDVNSLALIGQDIIDLDFQIDQQRKAFQENLKNSNIRAEDGSLRIIGDNIFFDPTVADQSGQSNEERIRSQEQFRKKLNSLTQRRLWKVKSNTDPNLLIIDDSYDENYDIQAFEKSLTSGLSSFRSTYTKVGEKIEGIASMLGLEVFADTGLSSYQLDASGRGISFQKKEPLDMRFDLSKDTSDAKFILNNHDEQDLTKIFEEYGEEKYAKAIARKIVSSRNEKPFHYTTDLVEAITEALPKPVKHLYADSCRRIFQALRIAVNHELENLERFLPKALDILAPGGRLVIVSFHSLEDRIVKQFFLKASRGCVCPIDFPECICGKSPLAKVLTKKIVTATEAELETNMRSKPAKLRAIQKI